MVVGILAALGSMITFYTTDQKENAHDHQAIRELLQTRVDELRALSIAQTTDVRNSSRQQYNEVFTMAGNSIQDLRARVSDNAEALNRLQGVVDQALLYSAKYDARTLDRLERVERQLVTGWQNHPAER